jgi:hypothetical protein
LDGFAGSSAAAASAVLTTTDDAAAAIDAEIASRLENVARASVPWVREATAMIAAGHHTLKFVMVDTNSYFNRIDVQYYMLIEHVVIATAMICDASIMHP